MKAERDQHPPPANGEDIDLSKPWLRVTMRDLIMERADPNDAYKLAHWEAYRQRRFVPSGALCDDLLMFDTTAPTQADYDNLLARIVGEPKAASLMPPVPV